MDLNSEIGRVAQEIYEQSGRAEGRDLENWLEAENLVISRRMSETEGESGEEAPRKRVRKTKRG
ncbi:MAG: DUF2934 domain-containing protein [Nitrospirales bacterium]|nr:DUF2934 domain-containing protein [Nitrospirales bacterium]